MKTPPWLALSGYSYKIVPPNALKMHSLPLSALRSLCRTFSKLLKFTFWSTLPFGWFLNNSHIQKQNLHGYKLVRAVKWFELKRCSKEYIGNHTKYCKLFLSFNDLEQVCKEIKKKWTFSWSIVCKINENAFVDNFLFCFEIFLSHCFFSSVCIFVF